PTPDDLRDLPDGPTAPAHLTHLTHSTDLIHPTPLTHPASPTSQTPRTSPTLRASFAVRDFDQGHIENEHPIRRALSLVREVLRNPEADLLAFHHQLQAFGPPRDDAIHRKCCRLTRHNRALEHLAIRRPARVMHRHLAAWLGVTAANALSEDLVCEAARGLLCVGRRCFHVGRRTVRHIHQLDV